MIEIIHDRGLNLFSDDGSVDDFYFFAETEIRKYESRNNWIKTNAQCRWFAGSMRLHEEEMESNRFFKIISWWESWKWNKSHNITPYFSCIFINIRIISSRLKLMIILLLIILHILNLWHVTPSYTSSYENQFKIEICRTTRYYQKNIWNHFFDHISKINANIWSVIFGIVRINISSSCHLTNFITWCRSFRRTKKILEDEFGFASVEKKVMIKMILFFFVSFQM